MDRVRVLRIIEYVGDRDWVERTLKNGSVSADGTMEYISKGRTVGSVKSCLVDKFPEILEKEQEQ